MNWNLHCLTAMEILLSKTHSTKTYNTLKNSFFETAMLCGVTAYWFQYNKSNEYSKKFIEINNLHLKSFNGNSRQNGYRTLNSHNIHILFLVKPLTHPSSPPVAGCHTQSAQVRANLKFVLRDVSSGAVRYASPNKKRTHNLMLWVRFLPIRF